jgi:hypothetical protein
VIQFVIRIFLNSSGIKFTAKLDFESSRGYLLLKVKENRHSRFDLLHNPESTARNSHGYIHRRQQRNIDGYKKRGAGEVPGAKSRV